MTPTNDDIHVLVTQVSNEAFYFLRILGIDGTDYAEIVDFYSSSTEATLAERLDALELAKNNVIRRWNQLGLTNVTPLAPHSPFTTLTSRLTYENNQG